MKRDTPELLVVWPSGSRNLIMYRADFSGGLANLRKASLRGWTADFDFTRVEGSNQPEGLET